MDNNTVIVIALFALVIIVAAVAYRHRLRGKIKGPLNTELTIDASNPTPDAGATIEGATSHAGSILAEDQTGRGASVKQAEAHRDVTAVNRRPETGSAPKA